MKQMIQNKIKDIRNKSISTYTDIHTRVARTQMKFRVFAISIKNVDS